jgi:hypothetical protein
MVPATTSTARTVRKNLIGFIRSSIGRKPSAHYWTKGWSGGGSG